MSMAAALSNVFSVDRQRARFTSNRIEAEEPPPAAPPSLEGSPRQRRTSVRREESPEPDEESPVVAESSSEESETAPVVSVSRPTLTLAELEEERELARRRSSACVLLAAFVLFRLWITAIAEGDFGLLLICLVGTSWTARWISYNREREEELDRRIANYLEDPNSDGVDRNELRMLSFQAQLALAIMESQRQMMQGGYGNPDGSGGGQGVSEEAKSKWDRFQYKPSDESHEVSAEKDSLVDGEEPHCSICLGEYEEAEDVVRLPCGHLYHDECISSWTSNHIKCPLCNFDLQSVASGDEESADNSIV